jgi:tripartite-type tricarboxylate transporter receptor subunit TctC
MDALIGGKKTNFDSRKFTWLGSANESTSACFAWHDAKVNTLADLMKTELVVGASSGGSSTFAWPTAMNNVLGTKFKIVAGYPGSKAIVLAMEKGEVKGLCGYFLSSIRSVRPTWLPEKKVKILVLEAVKPHPDFPGVKTVMDYAKTEDDKKILNIVFGWQVMGRPFAAPPGIPAGRAKALREAFWKTMQDPAFLADAKKSRIQIEARTHKQVQDYLDAAWQTPKPLVQKVFIALGRDKAKKKKK